MLNRNMRNNLGYRGVAVRKGVGLTASKGVGLIVPEKVRLTASEMGRRAVQKRVSLIVPRRGHPRLSHNSRNVLLEAFLIQKKPPMGAAFRIRDW